MINLMIKNIFENSSKINAVEKYVVRANRRTCFNLILVGLLLNSFAVTIKEQEKEIDKIKAELKEMKSKGE